MGRELFGRYQASGDRDRLDPIFLCCFHVVWMVTDEGYAGSAMDQFLAPRMLQSDANKARSGGGHFGEGAEMKKFPQTGMFHFLPSDARQISGN